MSFKNPDKLKKKNATKKVLPHSPINAKAVSVTKPKEMQLKDSQIKR